MKDSLSFSPIYKSIQLSFLTVSVQYKIDGRFHDCRVLIKRISFSSKGVGVMGSSSFTSISFPLKINVLRRIGSFKSFNTEGIGKVVIESGCFVHPLLFPKSCNSVKQKVALFEP